MKKNHPATLICLPVQDQNEFTSKKSIRQKKYTTNCNIAGWEGGGVKKSEHMGEEGI